MNEKDLNNLQFILQSDEAVFDQWLYTASDDDVEYALALIQQVKRDYILKELELMESEQIELSEANDVINRIRNKR